MAASRKNRGALVVAGAIAVSLLLALPVAARAAVAHTGNDYDLDGSQRPVPASLNQLDLYTPDGAGSGDSRPVVVYVHGGGWKAGDKSNRIGRKADLFTEAGYVFASVNYRLSPGTIDGSFPPGRIRFPVHPHDIGEAIGWIDHNVARFGGDPSRILLIGHSAGAQLVSLVSTDDSYVKAFGVNPRHLIGTASLDTDAYDVTRRIAEGGQRTKAVFYSAFATPAENAADDTWADASPIDHADAGDPDFLLVTQAGAPGRIQSSREMATALGQDPGESVFLAPYDHAGINDAVGSPDDPAGETEAIMAFFERMVAGSQTTKVKLRKHPPPKIRIGDGKRVKVRFRFEAVTGATSFECRRDDGKWRRCSSPVSYEAKRGPHRFRVRAIASNDEAGPVKKTKFRVKRRR